MIVRAAAVSLAVSAALADRAGGHDLALLALLAAVPFAAAAALDSVGAIVDRPAEGRTLQAALWGACLALLVAGAALRGPARDLGAPPRLAATALGFALAVLVVKALVHAWTATRPRLARVLARETRRRTPDRLAA